MACELFKNSTVVGWTLTQCRLCNHQATLPLMMKLHCRAALCIMTHYKNPAPLQRKQKLELKQGQQWVVSYFSFMSQDALCLLRSLILFFSGPVISLCLFSHSFLFNSFCDEHWSPSVWQTMSARLPVLYVACSERTHVRAPSPGHEQFFIFLHRAQKTLCICEQWRAESNQSE